MIRQIICGREPPERFKRQTTHGGRFVLFPLFPSTPLALRHDPWGGNTWLADRNIAPWEKLHAVLMWWWNADVREQKNPFWRCREITVSSIHRVRYEKERTTVKNRFESSAALSKRTSRWAQVGCESMLLIFNSGGSWCYGARDLPKISK